MRDLLDRHRATIIAILALIVPLFLLYAHGRSPRRTTVVEHALTQVTGPVQRAAGQMLGGMNELWSGYIALVDLKADNDKLEGDVDLLTEQALRAQKFERENLRLRSLLEFKRSRQELKTVAAHIIGRDVSPYGRVLRVVIDVGREDGVRAELPVISSSGLVGQVKQVSGRYADIMLTVDPKSRVNVRVAEKGVAGTLQGSRETQAYAARLLYLQKAEPLAAGDLLVTSGHDKIFPPGIEVGYIRSVDERQRGVFYEVDVAPAVNFSTLEEVLIVVGVTDDAAALSEEGGAP